MRWSEDCEKQPMLFPQSRLKLVKTDDKINTFPIYVPYIPTCTVYNQRKSVHDWEKAGYIWEPHFIQLSITSPLRRFFSQ